jgi:hypothetical protein
MKVTGPSPFETVDLWPPLAIALATCAVYANSLNNPFLFDDLFHIVTNPDIRHIWPLWIPPEESTWSSLNARVLVRLSLACNYALGELNPVGYPLFNLGCHVLCAITLYGVARRALLETHFAARAAGLALTVAMVWVLHPINSECINYISQCSEVQRSADGALFSAESLLRATQSRRCAIDAMAVGSDPLYGIGHGQQRSHGHSANRPALF